MRLDQETKFLQLTEKELEQQCKELFEEAPIIFEAKKANLLEQRMHQIVEVQKITIPIIWIKGDLYLVGSQKGNC